MTVSNIRHIIAGSNSYALGQSTYIKPLIKNDGRRVLVKLQWHIKVIFLTFVKKLNSDNCNIYIYLIKHISIQTCTFAWDERVCNGLTGHYKMKAD